MRQQLSLSVYLIFVKEIDKNMIDVIVSVIIPIYNVENFIDRGISFLLNQTYRHFEIILVDDGSTDGSLEKCQYWAQREERISVIHQENQGAGGARNKGIDNAKGRYIYFFDIDDEISKELIERNVQIMETYKVDFVLFGYKSVETVYKTETVVSFQDSIIRSNADLKYKYIEQFNLKMNGFPWNKFYRKSFLDKYKIRFENQRIQQDEVFNLKVYHYLDKAYVSSDVLYTYYIYNNGNTRSRFIPDRFDIYKSVRHHFDDLKDFWNLEDHRLDDYLNKRFYQSVMACLLFNLTHPKSTFTKQQAKVEINRVMDDPLTIEAFDYARKNITGIEQRLYRKACQSRSLLQIRILTGLFSLLRKVHNLLKR